MTAADALAAFVVEQVEARSFVKLGDLGRASVLADTQAFLKAQA